MEILDTRSTERFITTSDGEAQLLHVVMDVSDPYTAVRVSVDDAVVGSAPADSTRVDVPLTGLIGRAAGETYQAVVHVGDLATRTQIIIAEPGWTAWMIPHFHYDPVWWNTQAAYTATWDDLGGQAQQFRQAFQQTGFALVGAHLQAARLDPAYKFVLAEVDYLKPYWDARPAQRAYIRRLIAEGRLEIMGGTYNEPNTNLTTAETTIRNLVYGSGFQRDVLGADPQTAWQLDVFGHDPQFPGLAADAGLSSSSWARGPHHQWGPMLTQHGFDRAWADPSVMQFPAEFEWISPSGRGVLTHYMPAHYSAGWRIDSCTTLADAEDAVYELFLLLKRVASTRNILLPVGTDYTPPSKWVTEIQRDWNARYSWPRFECAIPRQFFAAVRRELEADSAGLSPQTRDMNPIYTGKDVSYIDTKQAQRAAEGLLVDAEMFATFAALRGARYPHAALDKAWRQLVFGAHHDGITGSESDQVYLDLLTGWREAHDIGAAVLDAALDHLTGQLEAPAIDSAPITVFNPSAWDRVDVVTAEVTPPHGAAHGLQVIGPDGQPVPSVVDHQLAGTDGSLTGARVSFLADVPAIGHRAGWRVQPTADATPGWTRSSGTSIESDRYLIAVDPERGGCVSRLFDKRSKRETIRPADVGNEIVIAQEYSEHPELHEGPWHLVPTGQTVRRSSTEPADSVAVETSALGQRITVHGRLGAIEYSQQITLWHRLDRIDCRTTLDGFDGANQLVRLRWAVDLPGALPVSDVSCAVVGRGYAFPDTDVVDHPWTLDNPAVNWFALSSTARVRVSANDREPAIERAIGIAELIASDRAAAESLRELAVALAGQGVTATTSVASGARYGNLAIDSNLPDVRIAVGGPEENAFTAAVLDDADEQYRMELDKQVSTDGCGRIWVPARRPLREVWRPSANLTGARDLPVLIIVGEHETDAVITDLSDAVIEVRQLSAKVTPDEPTLEDYTVALINSGMPSFNIDTGGAMCMSVLRSCTGWPSGVWIDPPRRTAPDGSNFQQQHWTHHFDYSVIAGAGDWRRNRLVRAGHELNHPLRISQAVPAGQERPSSSYLSIDSRSHVLLTAVKPSGNPLACGRSPGTIESLTIRVAEAMGASTTCTVAWPLASGRATALDLLERPVHDASLRTAPGNVTADLAPMQIRTFGLPVRVTGRAVGFGEFEPAIPVYTRYWLNNTGPAPCGGLPITVHAEPSLVDWSAGSDVELKIAVSSDRTDNTADVAVRVVVPSGWHVAPSEFPVRVSPGQFAEHTVRVTPVDDPPPGSWWVRVQAVTNEETIEDVTRIVVGNRADPELSAELIGPAALSPGQSGGITLRLANNSHNHISTQIQLISPWHTWQLLPEWNTGTELPPLETVTLTLPVNVPASAAPGSWWVLAKLATAGVLHYTEPVELVVRRP